MFAILDGEWLNDEIVNTGVGYIRHMTQEHGRLKVWVTNSFFMNSLYYNEQKYKYSNVRRWTRRAKVDITDLDRVVVPINLGSVHWICACIFLKDKEIVSYDSMARSTRYPELKCLQQWVSDETADKKGENNRWDTSSWTLRAANAEDVPQQHNGCDCGIFMYCICRSLALGQPFDFTQKDMAFERRNLALQLVRHYRKLLQKKEQQT
jgi:Ulp1 family protease